MNTNTQSLRNFISISILLALTACGGGGGSNSTSAPQTPLDSSPPVETVTVSGGVQKGPFIVGTSVLVNILDESGNPTDSTILTEITDSIGSFSFSVDENSIVQIAAEGYYYNELNGNLSNGTLSLKAIYSASGDNNNQAYVNILTHLINDRVLELIRTENLDVDSAISQSQAELISALEPVLHVENISSFTNLSIFNESNGNENGNGYLLALSTAFYHYAESTAEGTSSSADAQLSLILNQITDDFATDGTINQNNFTNNLTSALRSLNPSAITENLINRSSIGVLPRFYG